VYEFILDCAKGVNIAERKLSTIKRYLSTISVRHGAAGFESPTGDARIIDILSGVARTKGSRRRLAEPLTSDLLQRILVAQKMNARDWAILCFGQATACRRSELCSLNLENLKKRDRGISVLIERSKTDQEGEGARVGVRERPGDPLCPVLAAEEWIAIRGRSRGALFLSLNRWGGVKGLRLSSGDISLVVKRGVASIGVELLRALAQVGVRDRRQKGWQDVGGDHGTHEARKPEGGEGILEVQRGPV
jgi:integrase